MEIGNVPDNPLVNLQQQIREHWEEYFPTMAAALKDSGEFESAVQSAALRTKDAVLDYVSSHGGGAEALMDGWMLYRNEWALLESEEQPDKVDTENS